MKMLMLKTPEEIELIKQGARIADLGGEAAVKVIKEGVGEHEIAVASTNQPTPWCEKLPTHILTEKYEIVSCAFQS